MAGRRINKILTVLKGQQHVIELHDFITREFLINNDTAFFEKFINGISWPEKAQNLSYKLVPGSGSNYQFALDTHEKGDHNNEEDKEMEDDNNEHWSKSMISDTYREPDMCEICVRYVYDIQKNLRYRVPDMCIINAENR